MNNTDLRCGPNGRVPDAQLHRICRMEMLLDIAESGQDTPRCSVQEARRLLTEYYFGPQWRQDYEADEAGLLPPGLKRGILAEDTLYNLLTE